MNKAAVRFTRIGISMISSLKAKSLQLLFSFVTLGFLSRFKSNYRIVVVPSRELPVMNFGSQSTKYGVIVCSPQVKIKRQSFTVHIG